MATEPPTMDIDVQEAMEEMERLKMEEDKRPKEPLPLAQRQRHESLWYKSGNVVIATPKILFRVYDGILAQHSPIFRDMFSLPQPNTGPDQLDGVPVVHLHDDPEELSHFLRALYDRFYYCHKSPTEFAIVLAVLRLSTKYQIATLREQAITHLASVYADTLECIDFVMEDVPDKRLVYNENELDLIRIARETEAMRLLPSAFYWITNDPSVDYDLLPRNDVMKVLNGRGRLRQALRDEIGKFLYEPSPDGCFGGEMCPKLKAMFKLTDWWMLWDDRPSILDPGLVTGAMKGLTDMCAVCKLTFQSSMEEGRQNVWDTLPAFFDLPNWEELKKTTGC